MCRSQTRQNCKGVSEMSEGWETLIQACIVLLGQRSGCQREVSCSLTAQTHTGARSDLGFGDVGDNFCPITAT